MATANDPYAIESQIEAAPFNRQREMAKILQQQSSNVPQGQMVSGHYVAPSFFQYLAPLVQGGVSQYLSKDADKEQLAQAAALREQSGADLARAQGIAQGQEAIPAQQGPMPQGGNLDQTTGQKAVAANPQLAAQELMKSRDPALRSLGLKYLEGYKLGEGEIQTSGIFGTLKGGEKFHAPLATDVGNAIEYRDPKDPSRVLTRVAKGVSPGEAARLADEGIAFAGGGGGGGSNQGAGTAPLANPKAAALAGQAPAKPVGSSTATPQATQSAVKPTTAGGDFTPATLPVYENDPNLSPKQNREARAKFNETINTSKKNAQDSYGVVGQSIKILKEGNASSGRGSNIVTGAGEFFGYGGKASQADSQLTALGGQLTSKVPRFEGPQSNTDVALYKSMAGDVGNANLPRSTRLAALNTIIDLNEKYYPGGNWAALRQELAGNAPKAQGGPANQINLSVGPTPKSFTASGGNTKNAPSQGLSQETRSKYGL